MFVSQDLAFVSFGGMPRDPKDMVAVSGAVDVGDETSALKRVDLNAMTRR